MATAQSPVARGPLVELHRQHGATFETVDGWQVATRYPSEPASHGNALVDISHWPTFEVTGRGTGAALSALCGVDVPPRSIHTSGQRQYYRLTPARAILFGAGPTSGGLLDVTGGWASLALFGPQAERILNKVTAVDLREQTLPQYGCCQGPIFGVNTLFGRFPGRFELHVCTDSAQFFWEVLMDAGAEFELHPAGLEFYRGRVQV